VIRCSSVSPLLLPPATAKHENGPEPREAAYAGIHLNKIGRFDAASLLKIEFNGSSR